MPGQPSNLEEGVFPVIWAQLPKKGFNIDPPSVKNSSSKTETRGDMETPR